MREKGKNLIEQKGGETTEKDSKGAVVLRSGTVTRTVENVGTANQHVIDVELKKY